jgi:HK97 family phage major capsid protein
MAAVQRRDAVEREYRELLGEVEQRIAGLPDTATAGDVDRIESESRVRLDEVEARLEAARSQVEKFERIAEARKASAHLIPAGDLVVREPRTYNADDPEGPSFFADLFRAQRVGDQGALERLQRNNREVAEARGVEGRAVLTTSDFYPPVWADKAYVVTMRPRLVYAGLVQQLPLPPYGETVTIPKYTGPQDAANFQAGDNAAVETAPGSTSQLTAPICLAAGFVDVARQAVERALPGLDQVIFGDISRDIAHKIEVGCLTGSGTNQPLGILQNGSVPSVSVSGQTAAQLLLKLADLSQRIEVAVGEPANFVLMHPRRFGWLASLLDSNGRPLIVPTGQGPFNSFGLVANQGGDDGLSLSPDVTAVGWLAGLPVFTSSSIPVTSGAGTNEDWVLVGVRDLACRWSDPASIRSFTFEGVASSTASIRLQALTYSSYITRYPAAFGIIEGLTTPGF